MERISKQELYRLRNKIIIERLIADVLAIPSKTIKGRFRFCCPLCNGYNTGVKPETNLSRCFTCGKNFNTIDLTMRVKKLDFISSVSFLKQCLEVNQTPRSHGNPKCPSQHKPAHIGEVLSSIIPKLKSDKSTNADQVLFDRLLSLEKKVDHLTCRLNQISRLLK